MSCSSGLCILLLTITVQSAIAGNGYAVASDFRAAPTLPTVPTIPTAPTGTGIPWTSLPDMWNQMLTTSPFTTFGNLGSMIKPPTIPSGSRQYYLPQQREQIFIIEQPQQVISVRPPPRYIYAPQQTIVQHQPPRYVHIESPPRYVYVDRPVIRTIQQKVMVPVERHLTQTYIRPVYRHVIQQAPPQPAPIVYQTRVVHQQYQAPVMQDSVVQQQFQAPIVRQQSPIQTFPSQENGYAMPNSHGRFWQKA